MLTPYGWLDHLGSDSKHGPLRPYLATILPTSVTLLKARAFRVPCRIGQGHSDLGFSRAQLLNRFKENYPDRQLPSSSCIGCLYNNDSVRKQLNEYDPKSFQDAIFIDQALRDVPPIKQRVERAAYLYRSSTTTTSCLIGWLDRLCWVVWVMDAESFERVYDSLQEFHAFFAASFGRKQWREHSGNYLQALLVQDQERRNAENLSESVGISARAMQRFLTEARWSDETVIGRLQKYLAPRLGHPEAVWVFDGSDFPKQGRKSAGVARQYCGRLGKVANCQGGMFLAYVSPLGRALVDKRLYLPKSWTSDQDRCAAAGVPEDRRNYRSKTELALELLERAMELGYLRAQWVAGDDAFGMSPSFREGLEALGMWYVLDVPGSTTVWPLEPAWTSPEYPGFGRPRKPRLRSGQRRTMEQRGDELPDEAWQEITVAQGSQGPRTYRFSAQRVRATRRRKPGEEGWAVWRRNLDGSEPRYYLSNAPEDTTLETLACVGGSRWRIETEFETEKGDVGMDEYETRSWAGWHHHIAMCLLGGAFLLGLQQDWGGKDAPDHETAGVPGGA